MADSKKKSKFAPDITELKSLSNPPQDVKQTLFALFLVLGKPLEKGWEWKSVKVYLGNIKVLVDWIETFDPKTCSPEVAEIARETIKGITVDQIKKVNMAAVSLFVWTDAQINLVLSQDGSGAPVK